MTTHLTAPDIPNPLYPDGGYPTKMRRLSKPWAELWNALAHQPDEFKDIYPIAEKLAAEHDVSPTTLIGLAKRAAAAGLLEKTGRMVNTGKRGNRERTHYRIAEPEEIFKS